MTLPAEQPLSQFIEDLLLESAPHVRPAPVSSEPTRPRLAPDHHAGRAPVAQSTPRCPICGEWVGSAFRRRQKATRWVDGVEYHRLCLGDGQ